MIRIGLKWLAVDLKPNMYKMPYIAPYILTESISPHEFTSLCFIPILFSSRRHCQVGRVKGEWLLSILQMNAVPPVSVLLWIQKNDLYFSNRGSANSLNKSHNGSLGSLDDFEDCDNINVVVRWAPSRLCRGRQFRPPRRQSHRSPQFCNYGASGGRGLSTGYS